MRLSELIQQSRITEELSVTEQQPDPDIVKITDDSRQADTAALFVVTSHGRDYLDMAIRLGVPAVLIEKSLYSRFLAEKRLETTPASSPIFILCENIYRAQGELSSALYCHPSYDLHVVGITGTNGKTSIANILYHIWKSCGVVAGVIGTLGAKWMTSDGREKAIFTGYTTPRAPQLHELLDRMRLDGVLRVALEVSSEGIELGRVEGCRFSAAVFTNLTQDHLDFHGDMESYYLSKQRLFTKTGADGGRMIVSQDDSYGKRLAAYIDEHFPGRLESVLEPISAVPSVSVRFQRMNAALAVQAAFESDRDRERALKSLEDLPEIPGRFNLIFPGEDKGEEHSIFGVVDYAHSPAALENLLREVRSLSVEFLICVFGCGGDRDRTKRFPMGEIAARYSDAVILTDDNPRNENPPEIRKEIARGIRSEIAKEVKENGRKIEFLEIGERRGAIEAAVELAIKQNLHPAAVVVAGKGHEEYQITGSQRIEFSDKKELKAAFERYEKVETKRY